MREARSRMILRERQSDDFEDDPELYEDEDRDSYEADILRQEDMYGDVYTSLEEEEDLYDEEDMYEELDEEPDDQGPDEDELDERTSLSDDPHPMRDNYRDDP